MQLSNGGLLEDVAARLSDWGELDRAWAMATMISPNRALTVAAVVQKERLFEIILPRRPFESVGVDVLVRDDELGFAILGLRRPFEISPVLKINAPSGPCTTLSFSPDAPDGELAAGELDGPNLHAEFMTSNRVALGAPVAANDAVVGIVARFLESSYSVLPISLVMSLPAAVKAGLGEPQLTDFRALEAGAATVIDHAAGFANSLSPDIHMQHLLLALAATGHLEVPFPVLVKALADPRVSPAATYRSAPRGSEEMPAVSGHVQKALANAVVIAASRGATRVSPADLLAGAMQLTECDSVEKIRTLVSVTPQPQPVPVARPVVAGYLSDTATADNSLGFRKQAYDLCTVLATKDVKPPVSIGLFGDWGAGKSSFMKLMEVEFRRIEAAANKHKDSVFCRRIVQLWFNAWHYIDDNLYAGITREIFEGLGFALATPEKPMTAEELAFQRRAAEQEENAALEAWQHSKAKSDEATRAVKETQREVEQLNIGPKALESVLTLKEIAVEVTSFVSGDEEVKSNVRRAAETMKYPVRDAEELLENVHGTGDALRELLLAPRNLRLWVLLGLAAVFVNVLVPGLLKFAGGAAFLTYLGWAFAAARAAARFIERARKREAEILKQKQGQLKAELDRRSVAESSAKQDEADKAALLEAARQRSLAVQPERRMVNFVRERLAAWQKDSGVIAAVHRDFRELSRFLQRVSTDAGGNVQPAIDRIVLYIDDLDRCPEEKVFQVLQAVHLLLAFDLFVVVVAVDSQWLLESVRAATKRIKAPENYLEKIFQIPYTLDAMPPERFGAFVKTLTSTLRTTPVTSATKDVSKTGIDQPSQPAEQPDVIRPGISADPIPDVDPSPEHLSFEQHEVDFTTALYPFMSSPRNTKRFVNVYRLVRATLEPAELAAFRDAKNGAHEPAQFLIAIVTNQHKLAPAFCTALRTAQKTTAWSKFSEDFFPIATPHGDALRELNKAHPMLAARNVEDFQKWLPRVARYSFEMGRLIGTAPADTAPSGSPSTAPLPPAVPPQ